MLTQVHFNVRVAPRQKIVARVQMSPDLLFAILALMDGIWIVQEIARMLVHPTSICSKVTTLVWTATLSVKRVSVGQTTAA
jgi:hypothetical protein